MQNKRIVITGGPGTGKSSVIVDLETKGFSCLHEVSREITLEAQRQGIEQLFLDQPLLFSKKLLEARVNQHLQAKEISEEIIFIDRGIPDVVAYMDYFGTEYPKEFTKACEHHTYTKIFLMPPWQEIYKTDNERYESFEQAVLIHEFLKKAYINYGYDPIEVPKLSVDERSNFILSNLGK
ncbi:Predicted ATPase [Gillisia sp. Hel1_33_143]|uniref:AAA family ATPase n=1 Tax=Gillisia sp. Hel1_33_143 TaxID=1336796 RepID=UPI00087BE06F|nr:ATP-binding protein [Gillisia sp. Hel1_33_143]SDS49937.1 Predicted ATPase [Gillisia sp. Hel1_33_143]